MTENKEGLWYVSQPFRLGGAGKEAYREEVLQGLIEKGYDVIHPFNAFRLITSRVTRLWAETKQCSTVAS